MRRPPKLCQNRYRKSAYVTINGKQIYLGKWGSEEAQAAYDRLIIEWAKTDGLSPVDRSPNGALISELIAAFIEVYWTGKIGQLNRRRLRVDF